MIRLLAIAREIAGGEPPNAHHVADALKRLNEGCATEVLKRLGIGSEQITIAIGGTSMPAPSIENLLATAESERMKMHHRYLGTEHLLLALLQGCGGVRLLFEKHGVGLASARHEVLKELDPNFQLPDESA